MTLRQLEYFLTIANKANISAAAEELNMSQPPLSMQLKLLESDLGTSLFKRLKHKMILTDAGIVLQDRAEQILDMVEDTSRTIHKMHENCDAGTLRIGAVSSVCLQLLPQKAAIFLQHHPHVDFVVWEASANRVCELVKNGTVEIGFVRNPFDASGFTSFDLETKGSSESTEHEMVAIGHPSFFKEQTTDKIKFAELSGIPLVLFRKYDDMFAQISKTQGIKLSIVCRNDNPISSLGWAINGIGVAVLPRSSIMLDVGFKGPNALMMKTIIEPQIFSHFVLITNKPQKLSLLAEQFLKTFN